MPADAVTVQTLIGLGSLVLTAGLLLAAIAGMITRFSGKIEGSVERTSDRLSAEIAENRRLSEERTKGLYVHMAETYARKDVLERDLRLVHQGVQEAQTIAKTATDFMAASCPREVRGKQRDTQ